ncbi:MAG: DUF2723 domain-containing protein [Bacteroidota bacterium]|nr:DUF2723 domain-containing protein [Bacteroidota bacterium]MDP4195741.1 DUF2723 domain-containing protein [Bacteroidota bacterium]
MNIFRKYYVIFTGLFSLFIYLLTLAPSVVEIDSGELATVQATLGIAHPTGYPLFSILGYLFLLLPSPFTKILMANLLAALWCSLGVMLFTLTAKTVLDNLDKFSFATKDEKSHGSAKKDKKKSSSPKEIKKADELTEDKKIFASILGAFVLAFSKTFWNQSTSVEVYSLHIFLLILNIYFLVKAYLYRSVSVYGDIKHWVVFSLALALCFSNHMTTILLLPGIAYLYFDKNRFSAVSYKKLLIMLLCFFPLLIAIYSYLPLRASQNPVINWGNPIDMERILRHVSGKQYQVWLFSSMDSAQKQFSYFINNLPSEYAIISLLFIAVGLVQSFRSARKFFIFSVITFFSTVLYSINYNIVDIDSYFLLAYIALGFISVFGILKLFSVLKSHENSYVIPLSVISVLIVLQIIIIFKDIDRSGCLSFEDYTKGLLMSTDKKSLVFSYQWDYFVSETYYFQNVENFRKDVAVIDKELLRRSWYYNQLQRNHPDIAGKLQPFISPFQQALRPFERDEKFDPNLLERLYRDLMTHLVTDNMADRSVYIAPEIVENEMAHGEFTLPKGYYLIPDLFLFKVVKDTSYIPAADPNFKIRLPKNKNQYILNIQNFVGSMLVRRAMYEMKFDRSDRARVYINKIKSDLPDYQIPYDLANVFN